MKRAPAIVAAVTALFAYASCTGGGCSSSLRPSGALNVHGLDVSGGYTHFVGEAPVGLLRGAAVGIRREDSGAAVGGATVRIDGHVLTYDSAKGYYAGIVPGLACGDTVTVRVSYGGESIQNTIRVPFAITNLSLDGGAWDCSSPDAINTVTWTNPNPTGWFGIDRRIYDYDGETATLLQHSLVSSHTSSMTLANSALEYHEGISSILFAVGQTNFTHLGGGAWEMEGVCMETCVWRVWPVASPRAK